MVKFTDAWIASGIPQNTLNEGPLRKCLQTAFRRKLPCVKPLATTYADWNFDVLRSKTQERLTWENFYVIHGEMDNHGVKNNAVLLGVLNNTKVNFSLLLDIKLSDSSPNQ